MWTDKGLYWSSDCADKSAPPYSKKILYADILGSVHQKLAVLVLNNGIPIEVCRDELNFFINHGVPVVMPTL